MPSLQETRVLRHHYSYSYTTCIQVDPRRTQMSQNGAYTILTKSTPPSPMTARCLLTLVLPPHLMRLVLFQVSIPPILLEPNYQQCRKQHCLFRLSKFFGAVSVSAHQRQ